jgi:polygalacturonase
MSAKYYNVKDFGAVGGGTTLDSAGIQAAIDACGESGDGVVYFPGGSYLCGTLRLRSFVELEISAGGRYCSAARPCQITRSRCECQAEFLGAW